MVCATRACPSSVFESEVMIDFATDVTGLRAWIEGWQRHEVFSLPERFVVQLPLKFTQRSVTKTLGQLGSR